MALTPYDRPLSPETAAHFLRRTAFNGTEEQIMSLVGRNPRQVAQEALNFTQEFAPGNPFDPTTGATPGDMIVLNRAAWMYELLYSPQPLREKLALTWSNHFVIGTDKVRNYPSLSGYLGILRRNAAGDSFERFALEVAQSPAMLRYLDNDQNRAGKPNENFSRELLELFTTGIGNYTETDVHEGARALSGWTFQDGRGKNFLQTPQFVFNRKEHDTGQKTYLGKSGNLSGEDIVHQAATHPQTAVFIARKLHRAFVSDQPNMQLVQSSAETFRRSGGDLGKVLEELLSSAEFYASRQRIIRGPVEYTVGMVRALGQPKLNVKQVLNLTRVCARMGQQLLQPDTVKGWDGGREWINDSTLLLRMQVAASMTIGGGAPKLPQVPSTLALLGTERGMLRAALDGLNSQQQAYLTLISPEFQLA